MTDSYDVSPYPSKSVIVFKKANPHTLTIIIKYVSRCVCLYMPFCWIHKRAVLSISPKINKFIDIAIATSASTKSPMEPA